MLQFFNKMPKQQEPKQQGPPKLNKRFIPPNNPSLGKIIDPSQKKPRMPVIDPGRYHGPKPFFTQGGSDLRALLRSRHTKETIHRGKHGPDMGHAANLFSNDHHAGGMGAVKGGHHVGHGKFTYKNHLGNQVKVPTGWEVDNFGSAYDPTKPHPM